MADQPGQEPKDTGGETIFNSGIGDDWGEAFEAEDFMAAPGEEVSTEFFLPDELTDGATMIPVAAAEVVTAVATSPPGLFARLQKIPLLLRIAVLVLPVLAVSLFFILRARVPEQPALSQETQTQTVVAPQPEAESPAAPTPEPTAQAPQNHPSEQQVSPESPHSVSEDSGAGTSPLEAKEIRKKWRFPALLIQAKTDQGQAPVLLSIDLTLNLKLAPEVMPPSGRESFLREILYQFYTNQPVDDLQRYALDRGEMNRKLRAWILKQWPELHLESIVIDHYQLL
jgi:hypothetical protein